MKRHCPLIGPMFLIKHKINGINSRKAVLFDCLQHNEMTRQMWMRMMRGGGNIGMS